MVFMEPGKKKEMASKKEERRSYNFCWIKLIGGGSCTGGDSRIVSYLHVLGNWEQILIEVAVSSALSLRLCACGPWDWMHLLLPSASQEDVASGPFLFRRSAGFGPGFHILAFRSGQTRAELPVGL